MTTEKQKAIAEALRRCYTLLRATSNFMEENPIAAEYTVHYDGTGCDGSCLGDDCDIAGIEVKAALAALESEPAEQPVGCSCRSALAALPLEFFDESKPGLLDAADFVDHAGEFMEAMRLARAAIASPCGCAGEST